MFMCNCRGPLATWCCYTMETDRYSYGLFLLNIKRLHFWHFSYYFFIVIVVIQTRNEGTTRGGMICHKGPPLLVWASLSWVVCRWERTADSPSLFHMHIKQPVMQSHSHSRHFFHHYFFQTKPVFVLVKRGCCGSEQMHCWALVHHCSHCLGEYRVGRDAGAELSVGMEDNHINPSDNLLIHQKL